MSHKLTQIKQFMTGYKKQLTAIAAVVIIAFAGSGVLHEALRVEGLVTNLTASEVTVADLWGSRSVAVDDSWLKDGKIKVGDRVEILQNWQGQATDIRVENSNDRGIGDHRFNHGEKGHH